MREMAGPRAAAMLAAFALVVAACGGSTAATTEPTQPAGAGGGEVAPESLELGREYRHQIPSGGTGSTRHTFQVPPGGVVQVDGSADGANRAAVALRTAPPQGLNLGISVEPGGSGSTRPWITSDTGGGTWILEIAGIAGDTVSFTVTAPVQTDGGGTADAGGHAGTAVAIELGGDLDGLLGDEDREDWYAVPLRGGDVVAVSLEVPPDETGSVEAAVVFNGTRLGSTNANPGGTSSLTQVFAQSQVGAAQLQVTGTGRYRFSVETGPQRDGGSEGDAGASIGDAKSLAFGSFEGILGGEDDEDFYTLTLPRDSVIAAEASIAPDYAGTARFEIIYNGQNLISEALSPGASNAWTYALVNAADATAYVRVASGAGAYAFSVTATTQPDGDGSGDASGERTQARVVDPEGSFEGILNNRRSIDPRDWYTFEATQSGSLEIELAVAADGAEVRMLVHDGVRRIGDLRIGGSGSTSHTIEVVAGQSYEFELITGGQASYTVTFT